MSTATATGTRPSNAAATLLCLALLPGFLAACGDDADSDTSASRTDAASAVDGGLDGGKDGRQRDGALPAVDCDDDAGLSTCGTGMHCERGACVPDLCGDGVRSGSEECDDGNQSDGDACTPACTAVMPHCQDGDLDDGEECDDGNLFDADECSNRCTKNECGNGRVDLDEECDDANLAEGVPDDFCSNECLEIKCRNGRVEPGEECDDGNLDHDDGCTNACRIVVCGNGRREDEEECDDGNDVDDDACADSCQENACGNARVDPGEVCDGNVMGKICSPDCKTLTANEECQMCEELACSDVDGNNLVTGCYDENPEDPMWNDLCIAVLECGLANKCAQGPNGFAPCWCGTATPAQCAQDMGINGPCMQILKDATMATTNAQVNSRIRSFAYPSGFAINLVECQRDFCPACLPPP